MSIHDQITADAAIAKAQAQKNGMVPYEAFDSLKSLIDAATDAVYENLPATFEHCGKTYRLITDIQRARVCVFSSPEACESLLVAIVCLPSHETN